MLIVSQNKKVILNLDNVSSIAIDNVKTQKMIYTRCNNKDMVSLGGYASEERAKEVLQGITRAYEKAGNIHFETDDDEKILNLTHNSNVFEMPKK